MSQENVAPGLLLAMPQLVDPNFYRTVVLMLQHDDEGSVGVVINRVLDLRVREVMRQLRVEWKGAPDTRVFWGGPVAQERGWLLHEPTGSEEESEGTVVAAPGLAVSTSLELLGRLASSPPGRFRFLLGYAGWEGGQLERELAEGAWLLSDATADLVFGTPPDRMWEAALQRIHVDPASLVPAGGVH